MNDDGDNRDNRDRELWWLASWEAVTGMLFAQSVEQTASARQVPVPVLGIKYDTTLQSVRTSIEKSAVRFLARQ